MLAGCREDKKIFDLSREDTQVWGRNQQGDWLTQSHKENGY